MYVVNFFFQAEDGIRDKLVTGVQTCALPISSGGFHRGKLQQVPLLDVQILIHQRRRQQAGNEFEGEDASLPEPAQKRSEEHTSELQSLAYLVCRLLLEKKKRNIRKLQT